MLLNEVQKQQNAIAELSALVQKQAALLDSLQARLDAAGRVASR
jgi:hypothetical protein